MATLCALMLATLVACDRGEATVPSPFNGDSALGYVRTFMDFGARVPGTDAHKRAGDWIVAEMRQRADTVYRAGLDAHDAVAGATLPLRNVRGALQPDGRGAAAVRDALGLAAGGGEVVERGPAEACRRRAPTTARRASGCFWR